MPDGRYICARELKDVIQSEDEAKEICKGVKDDLDRLLSRYLTMPGDSVQVSIVDKYHLRRTFSMRRETRIRAYRFMARLPPTPLPNQQIRAFRCDLLSYLEKATRLMAAAVLRP